jgi:hypothetical protein
MSNVLCVFPLLKLVYKLLLLVIPYKHNPQVAAMTDLYIQERLEDAEEAKKLPWIIMRLLLNITFSAVTIRLSFTLDKQEISELLGPSFIITVILVRLNVGTIA